MIGKELIFLAVREAIKAVHLKTLSDIVRKIPLSYNSAQKRIDKIVKNIEMSSSDCFL